MTCPALPAETLRPLLAHQPFFWTNHARKSCPDDDPQISKAIEIARDRLRRSEGLMRQIFDLPPQDGSPIASALFAVTAFGDGPSSPWFIKGDHALPIAGSIKARGGFHEVIAYAERLAIAAGLIPPQADLIALASPEARALFASHSIVVGSTGNLGLSIGLCGAALGFRAVVHMSVEAKAWKKARLRDHGVEVVEHSGDYGAAVARGRALAAADPKAHFVDDERSVDLFAGYACAAAELKAQLDAQGFAISAAQPLIVYLPCGVGGAPGGIAYGLTQCFGPDVYCVFAEPVDAPCMLVQLASGSAQEVSVYDIGLTNQTELDGLAVATASMVVAPLMAQRLSGIYTVSDLQAHDLLRDLYHRQGVAVEPSAATALAGPLWHRDALAALVPAFAQAVHISWTTGGSLVPEAEFNAYLRWQSKA